MSILESETFTGALTAEESAVVKALSERAPSVVSAYLDELPNARRGMVHRLLQAALREDLAGAGGRVLRIDDGRTLVLPVGEGLALRVRVSRFLSMDRFVFEPDVELLGPSGEVRAVETPLELLRLLMSGQPVENPGQSARFALEIDNSSAHFALALAGARRRKKALLELSANLGDIRSSLDWVAHQMRIDGQFSPLALYEQWVIEGHPLHPGAKVKLGMSAPDAVEHAPEWGAEPGLALVAVGRSFARVTSLSGARPSDVLLSEHPWIRPLVAASLQDAGRTLDDVELIPVHPWQIKNTVPRRHAAWIARGEVVPLPDVRIPASALMSVRSMAPKARRGSRAHHVKTAIDVQLTNAIRTVSPQSAENGPRLSALLADFQAREDHFAGTFAVLREDVGVSYVPGDVSLSASERDDLGRHLGAIFRENPEDHASESSVAMPCAALVARSPWSDRPIVAELVERLARHRKTADLRSAALMFLRRYVEVSVPGFLTMLARYGVALEGHLQNSVAVFRLLDGWPQKMLVRDLGGVRIWPQRLNRHGIPFALCPGSATLASDVDDLRNKVYYAFYQNHLGELVSTLALEFDTDEALFWKTVADLSRQVFATLKQDASIRADAEEDENVLFRPKLALKALATMRLHGDVTRYHFADVPNPLASGA